MAIINQISSLGKRIEISEEQWMVLYMYSGGFITPPFVALHFPLILTKYHSDVILF